jgi:outer membrane biogenesis lipoprotein LolB
MKTRIAALLTAAIFLSSCSASTSAAKKEKTAADFEQTAALIESGSYQFTIRSASPSGGKTIQITSSYSLIANKGNYEAYLPYFGKAYSGGYGDSGGIEFNGEPKDLQIDSNDSKQEISVNFTIQAEKDKYTVKLNVGPSGFGTLVISSQKRQTITYSGLAGQSKD